jgi:hypothetical protein
VTELSKPGFNPAKEPKLDEEPRPTMIKKTPFKPSNP